mmetsp:Transcript_11785/g.33948  ORF Transcript_11785/g.33948 Transcript_11785/m.33948 type:complete len:344 (+) Transcript_11785:19-1050(+)
MRWPHYQNVIAFFVWCWIASASSLVAKEWWSPITSTGRPGESNHFHDGKGDPPFTVQPQQPKQQTWSMLVSCSIFLVTSLVSFPVASYDWDLLNGSVSLPESLPLQFADRLTKTKRSLQLTRPQIVGAGSGGAVFAFDEKSSQSEDFLLKISWEGTSKTVQRECTTLQLLEDRGVQAAERCLGSFEYPRLSREEKPRSMILVTPYMRDAVASVGEVTTSQAQQVAVEEIARTLVQMLAANVITIDVQPLISKTTGKTIFIDMTEAQVLSPSGSYSFLDRSLISSFTSEMVALIPEDYWNIANKATMDELGRLKEKETVSPGDVQRVEALLEEQTPFFSITRSR